MFYKIRSGHYLLLVIVIVSWSQLQTICAAQGEELQVAQKVAQGRAWAFDEYANVRLDVLDSKPKSCIAYDDSSSLFSFKEQLLAEIGKLFPIANKLDPDLIVVVSTRKAKIIGVRLIGDPEKSDAETALAFKMKIQEIKVTTEKHWTRWNSENELNFDMCEIQRAAKLHRESKRHIVFLDVCD